MHTHRRHHADEDVDTRRRQHADEDVDTRRRQHAEGVEGRTTEVAQGP